MAGSRSSGRRCTAKRPGQRHCLCPRRVRPGMVSKVSRSPVSLNAIVSSIPNTDTLSHHPHPAQRKPRQARDPPHRRHHALLAHRRSRRHPARRHHHRLPHGTRLPLPRRQAEPCLHPHRLRLRRPSLLAHPPSPDAPRRHHPHGQPRQPPAQQALLGRRGPTPLRPGRDQGARGLDRVQVRRAHARARRLRAPAREAGAGGRRHCVLHAVDEAAVQGRVADDS